MLHRASRRAWVLVAACALAVPLYAVQADDKDEEKGLGEPSTAVEVSAGELADKPAAYLGVRVKVRAEINDVYSPRAFTLDEDKVGASPDVLVLANDGAFPKDGKTVEVTGTVRRFVRTEIERDYSWFDLDKKYDVTYSERPVIVADTVLPVDD